MQPKNTIRDAHAVFQPTSGTAKSARRGSRRSRQVSTRDSLGGGSTPIGTPVSKGSVTTLQFQDDNTLISASDLDGIIKVIQNTTLRYRIYDESINNPERKEFYREILLYLFSDLGPSAVI